MSRAEGSELFLSPLDGNLNLVLLRFRKPTAWYQHPVQPPPTWPFQDTIYPNAHVFGAQRPWETPKLVTGRAEEQCLLSWPPAWDLPVVGELLQRLSFVGMIMNPHVHVELWC